ncbi:hypothetical protein [Pollutibacter soli]|uniref:hypothetical protein n=1 Tax=Pollutibacter soli TaxID=3034157 RepID=UPI003014197A
MNSAISGYSVKCSFFSAAPLGTALAEYQYSPSAATSSAKKSKLSGLLRHTAGNQFACKYSLQTANATYSMSHDISYRISTVGRHQINKGISLNEMTSIDHGITRCVPAGKFY